MEATSVPMLGSQDTATSNGSVLSHGPSSLHAVRTSRSATSAVHSQTKISWNLWGNGKPVDLGWASSAGSNTFQRAVSVDTGRKRCLKLSTSSREVDFLLLGKRRFVALQRRKRSQKLVLTKAIAERFPMVCHMDATSRFGLWRWRWKWRSLILENEKQG